MKRTLRVVWVLAVNGVVVCLTIGRLSGGAEARNFEEWIELLLEVFLPISGIALELVRWKFAKWVNVGYPALAACFWFAEAMWWRSDPFVGVLVIMAFGMLVVAALTVIVYRRTEVPAHEPAA
jgi:hypothetical protein